MKSKDNRRSPRSRHDSVLEIFDHTGHLITGVGRLVDVSSVGACFACTAILDPEATLRIRLRLLREGSLEATARIVWSRRKTNSILYGIEFQDVKRSTPRKSA